MIGLKVRVKQNCGEQLKLKQKYPEYNFEIGTIIGYEDTTWTYIVKFDKFTTGLRWRQFEVIE